MGALTPCEPSLNYTNDKFSSAASVMDSTLTIVIVWDSGKYYNGDTSTSRWIPVCRAGSQTGGRCVTDQFAGVAHGNQSDDYSPLSSTLYKVKALLWLVATATLHLFLFVCSSLINRTHVPSLYDWQPCFGHDHAIGCINLVFSCNLSLLSLRGFEYVRQIWTAKGPVQECGNFVLIYEKKNFSYLNCICQVT